jgi:hypothetical protein
MPGRGSRVDDAPRRGIGRPIIAILTIGLVVRLIMAYGFPPLAGSGFKTDLDLFRYWADVLATHGPWGFYANASYADYTPGYLYVLWVVGVVGKAIGGTGDLIKLPSILTDVALGWLVYSMARDLRVSERRATIAAAVVVFNPVTWFDSVVWGQVDSFGTVFLLLAVRELWRARNERAAILAVVAALIKPQLAILVPIVAVVVIRRALWPRGGWGDEEPPDASGFGWERRITGVASIFTTGVAAVVTAFAMTIPFALPVVSFTSTAPYLDSPLLGLVFKTAAIYPWLTVNAYNMWALFPVDGQTTAATGGWLHDAPVPDATSWGAIGPFPAALVGGLLLALLLFVVVPLAVARRPDRLTILVGTCALAIAFFAVPTRVHERYLFPLFGLAGILVAFSWRWRIAYALGSIAVFLNMYVVLTTIYSDNPNTPDWLGIGDTIRSFWGVALIALVNTGILVWGLLQLRSRAGRTLARELEDGQLDEDAVPDDTEEGGVAAWEREPRPPIGTATGAATLGAAAATAAAGAPGEGPTARRVVRPPDPAGDGALVPAWYGRPAWGDLGIFGALRARIRETPIRPDRSAELKREPGGRIDRLDVWIVLVMVVAAMCLRTYRLAEPARMHFDEVYHARTATEFLQDWRYGISHNIYEWTHPHLAKYAMALGIEAFAGHDVASSSDLGVPVRDAVIEPRRADSASASLRDGDRVWVVTGTELIAYDLETRKVEARWPVAGASTVTYDEVANQLFVGTDSGAVLSVDTTSLDLARQGQGAVPTDLAEVGTYEAPPVQLVAWSGGTALAARMADGSVAMMDASTGNATGSIALEGAVDIASAGEGDAVVATLADVTDAAAEAKALAELTAGDVATYEADLSKADTASVVLDIALTSDLRKSLGKAITAGTLPGIAIAKTQLLAVADGAGIDLLSDRAHIVDTVTLAGGAHGLALVTGLESGNQLYATTTDLTKGYPEISIVATSGDKAQNGPAVTSTLQMPGAVTRVLFDDSAQMVEVLGQAQDGSGPTVYVVEPHGNAVFADHKLGFEPVALVMDHNADYPSSSRGEILAFASSGSMASLDVGHYDFSWRMPGVILGALTVGVLYLLTRLLFRRRTVGVLAGLFLLLDGMSFVQSRIAMNDVYTGFFILAAYLLFAWLWVQPRSRRAFWTVMPAIGILLGLGLASKWVAAYAIGALGILVLARSALGRVLLIAGLFGITCVLGWMALAVPTGSKDAMGNVLFPLIMIVLTLAAVAITAYRPIAWSDDEVRFAVGAPAAAGIFVVLGAMALGKMSSGLVVGPIKLTPLPVGFGLVLLGGLVYLAFNRAGRMGIGPMAARPPAGLVSLPADPAPDGWLRLGDGLGLSTVWWAACLVVVPIVVYVISYLPWAAVESHQIIEGFPAGHTGQTLLGLTGEMYRYHNNLTAAHPASSPWWAWPLNLKPVWFYQGGFANNTAGAIYDAGNMVVWWLGIPAMAFVAWQAFRRRSLGLALILVGFLAQWVSWARIDRAAFQYHYYTSVPFIVMGLAYLVAEVWHGASRRTWLVVRAAGALAVMGPALLWLLTKPLCRIANVDAVNKGSEACHGNAGNLVITPSVFGIVVVGLVLLVLLVRQLIVLGRPKADGTSLQPRDMVSLVITALVGGVVLAATRFLPSTDPLFAFPGFVPELIALAALVPLGLVAIQVLTARDARRFVLGLVAAVAVWFVILYPNISALPLPAEFVNAYQGLLPTYLFPFQFAVNTVDRNGSISFASPWFAALAVALVGAAVLVAYSSVAWRQALAGGPAPSSDPEGDNGAGDDPKGDDGAGDNAVGPSAAGAG